jgi:hypothetical protein
MRKTDAHNNSGSKEYLKQDLETCIHNENPHPALGKINFPSLLHTQSQVFLEHGSYPQSVIGLFSQKYLVRRKRGENLFQRRKLNFRIIY